MSIYTCNKMCYTKFGRTCMPEASYDWMFSIMLSIWLSSTCPDLTSIRYGGSQSASVFMSTVHGVSRLNGLTATPGALI